MEQKQKNCKSKVKEKIIKKHTLPNVKQTFMVASGKGGV